MRPPLNAPRAIDRRCVLFEYRTSVQARIALISMAVNTTSDMYKAAGAADGLRSRGGVRDVARLGASLFADADGTRLSRIRRKILPAAAAASGAERGLFRHALAAAGRATVPEGGA